jgi:hypothetical protein
MHRPDRFHALGKPQGIAKCLAVALMALGIWTPCRAESEPVFPGAVGFGIHTAAGCNGEVVRVTNLHPGGSGSLRAALDTKGPRLIVFDTAGVIDLDKQQLVLTEPFVTIAGQTAPAPGITLIRGGLLIRTHDVLIQHISIRPGDAGLPKRAGWGPDGICTSGADAHDIIIDHCSITWAVDENASTSGPATQGPEATSRRVTFSNCIIAEALQDSTHSKGPHSCGSLNHDFVNEIAYIGNLIAHNDRRNPYFKAHTTGVVANNLIYNPGLSAVKVGYVPDEWRDSEYTPENCRISVVGNVLHHGVNTRPGLPLVSHLWWVDCGGSAYLADNRAYDQNGAPVGIMDHAITILHEKPVWPGGLEPMPADEVTDSILANAGSRPWDRDEIDQRIIREFRERKGRIIDSQEEVGGYPDHTPTHRMLDVPDTKRREWLDGLTQKQD